MFTIFKTICRSKVSNRTFENQARQLSELKKFYKNAYLCENDESYEINLDQRKLKTPDGNVVKLPTRDLAGMVVAEWSQQKDTIKPELMHITSLCYAAIDQAKERSAENLVKSSIKFLHTDTILFHMDSPEELKELQKEKWGKIINYIQEKHSVSIAHTYGFGKPTFSADIEKHLSNYLLTWDYWSITGFEKMTNVLKSVLLSLAVIDRHITIEDAVSLSRLEQEYQISKWGNVEWVHNMELLDYRMKTAACALFIQSCFEDSTTVNFGENLSQNN